MLALSLAGRHLTPSYFTLFGSTKMQTASSFSSLEDFSLEDLPEGHPIITRETLESIADFAFTTMRGLTLMGGQVKIDVNVLSGMMLTGGSPSEQVISILKPAALAYLEFESTLPSPDGDDEQALLKFEMDRTSIEFDFLLAQKSYAVTINALSTLALNRPGFYRDAILCLARRAVHSPSMTEEHTGLSSSGVKAVKAQIASSCLTLLRNPLSVSSNSFGLLQKALEAFEMGKQADKALLMARQAHSLKTAGRAARNRANVYYEWDTSGVAETDGGQQHRSSKRQRETDDALAKMRKMRAEKGLGHGIQLPTSMSDAVELILANLPNLAPTRPMSTTSTKSRKVPVSLDFVVDAIMTNGNSLIQEEGRWYERDGGMAWDFDLSSPNHFQPSAKFLETMQLVKKSEKEVESEADKKKRKLYHDQCETAATEALGRIISHSAYGRSKCLADFGSQIAARLAFTLQGSKQAPPTLQKSAYAMARESVSASKVVEKEKQDELVRFVDTFPLAASTLALGSSIDSEKRTLTETDSSIALRILNEAILKYEKESMQSADDEESTWVYDRSLDVFVASIVHAGEKANAKPSDAERKKTAAQAALHLQQDIAKLPRLTRSSLVLISRLCDIEEITKKSLDAARKTAPEDIAAGAAAHAAKVAAEKRATAALLILRDVAFQRDVEETRMTAIECAVGIAAGRLPSSTSVQEKALKLVMNVRFQFLLLYVLFSPIRLTFCPTLFLPRRCFIPRMIAWLELWWTPLHLKLNEHRRLPLSHTTPFEKPTKKSKRATMGPKRTHRLPRATKRNKSWIVCANPLYCSWPCAFAVRISSTHSFT
jgi:symplekin